jgi:hypothetical protein
MVNDSMVYRLRRLFLTQQRRVRFALESRRYGSVVEYDIANVATRVRFPVSACFHSLIEKHWSSKPIIRVQVLMKAFNIIPS